MHILAALLIATLMLQTGLESSATAILRALGETRLFARAVVLNFIVVPLVALGLCRLFNVSDEVTTGILLMAIAPGVPFLPLAAGRAKGGHLAFAVGLVFVFALIAVVTAPLTANLILPTAEKVRLPVGSFMKTLVLFQLVPLLIGLAISYANARASRILLRILQPLLLVLLLVIVLFIIISGSRALGILFGGGGIITIVLLVAISMVLGSLAGGRDRGNRVTLSLGTGLRNPGLALLIASTNFADTIVVPTVIAFLLLQAILSALVGAYYKRRLGREPLAGTSVSGVT